MKKLYQSKEQQHHYTHVDVIEQFKNAMMDAGIQPPDTLIGDGRLHRFKIDNKLNGAYVLHLDGRAAGYFENLKQGIKHRWKMAGEFNRLTDDECQAFRVLAAKQEADRKAEEANRHRQAAIKAGFIWLNSSEVTAEYPYLIKKKIKTHNCRVYKNAVVIPIYSPEGQLVNLQFVDETGQKRFLSGGKKKGCFSFIGVPTETILICEGWATGASLHEHSSHFVIVALDAGNLEPVAVEVSKLYPDSKIVICGDNDVSGIGQKKAFEAALSVKGKYKIPPIAGTDWNDFLNTEVSHG